MGCQFTAWDIGQCGCGPAPCLINVTVMSCNDTYLIGATVTGTGPNNFNGSCTTSGASVCTLNVTTGGTGTYTLTASYSGYTTATKTLTITCPGTTNVTFTLLAVTTAPTVCVNGCNNAPLPGATVTVTNSNGDVQTFTTGSNGCVAISYQVGYNTITAAYPPYFGQVSLGQQYLYCTTTGSLGTITLPVLSGYFCCGFGGQYTGPIPTPYPLTGSFCGAALTATEIPTGSGNTLGAVNEQVTISAYPASSHPGFATINCAAYGYTLPADIGTQNVVFSLSVDLCAGTCTVQAGSGGGGLYIESDCATLMCGYWLEAAGNSNSGWGTASFPTASMTLNSPPPAVSVTINLSPGGPFFAAANASGNCVGVSTPGAPPCTSITFTA